MTADLHTWTVIGPAPSKGDGRRVRLRCMACKSLVQIRAMHVRGGRVQPCRCITDRPATPNQPSNTNPNKEN